ncbi:MAG TPA: hypothetical protein VJ976_12560 [Ornithinimicrobium sp.]|uniref:hypothetical protein n=1 Tax=Ornithinimicrobium sp. TaxID=1977084 RepID=UPI002B46E8D7|nr:hypothetical protein [Ornithinimicrobium sp.]HKJ13205.1 hypothetical protein [Ornithinimicrobium sp.]
MLPSSLIFAVILAVWAAYLMQHWVRRRDHIATARSVDRFSEAMRVLERRQHGPRLDLSEPVAPSYAISPVRPASPDVVVKRAVPGPARQVVEQPGVGGAAASMTPEAAAPPARAGGSVRARGLVLLAAAGVMVTGTALGMVGVLPWWTAAIGIGVFVIALLAVRHTVRRAGQPVHDSRPLTARPRSQRTSDRPSRPHRSAAAAVGGAAAALAASAVREDERDSTEISDLDAAGRKAALVDAVPVVQARTSEVYDIDSVVQVVAEAPHGPVNPTQPSSSTEAAAPGTWQPVPVPPPTYTLKAKAVSFALPDELPADGAALSLEEEFEDLPVAIRGLA